MRVTSPNIASLATCLRHYAQIPPWGTSDTLKTLYDIPPFAVSENKNMGIIISYGG